MNKVFKWTLGRQSTPQYFYYKFKIFSLWRMDCYLIKYCKACAVGYHKDEVPGFNHYRCNIQLRGINRLCCTYPSYKEHKNRITIFKADEPHSFGMTLESGLILSVGWIKKK